MSTPCLFPPSSHLPGIARLKVREAKPFATGPTAGQLQWISSAREVHQKRMGRWDGLRKVEIMDLVGGALEPWNYIWLLMVNIIYNQLFWIGKSTIIITGWWWLEPWNFMTFHIGNYHHPNWRTHIFRRGWNHQPVDKRRNFPWKIPWKIPKLFGKSLMFFLERMDDSWFSWSVFLENWSFFLNVESEIQSENSLSSSHFWGWTCGFTGTMVYNHSYRGLHHKCRSMVKLYLSEIMTIVVGLLPLSYPSCHGYSLL